MAVIQSLGAALDLVAPPVSEAEARSLAQGYFGIDGYVRTLGGERDRNFHLRDQAGREFVIKVAHPDEDPQAIDLQSRALQHIAARAPDLPVPRLIPPLSQSAIAATWSKPGERPRLVRVLTYLPGQALASSELTSAQCRQIGSGLATLDRVLQDFVHLSEKRALLWDLQNAARVRNLLSAVTDLGHRKLAHKCLDNFETHVVPELPRLRRQVIHNDFNPHNVLKESTGKISGIIDFGDMVMAPLVQDFAVAAAYHVAASRDPLANVGAMAAAYQAGNPLEEKEIELLPDLLGTRLVLSVAIGSWRAALHPENAGYLLRNVPKAWNSLAGLDSISRSEAQSILKKAFLGGTA